MINLTLDYMILLMESKTETLDVNKLKKQIKKIKKLLYLLRTPESYSF